jgi:hypothetical protein
MLGRITLVAAAVLMAAACETQPTGPEIGEPLHAAAGPSQLNRSLAEIRAATARFHDVQVAMAEGYVPHGPCVAQPGLGGMGVHFVNWQLFADAEFSTANPEILMYEPQPDGSMRLVGVEFGVAPEPWYAAGNTARPAFEGRPFDDGPGFYALHVWVWKHNPAGIFAPFNPKVRCLADTEGHAH